MATKDGDVFEPIREKIRVLQAQLERQEDYYSGAMDALSRKAAAGEVNATTYAFWQADLMKSIQRTEHEIDLLMRKIPPHAVDRGGYIELLPAFEKTNVRATV